MILDKLRTLRSSRALLVLFGMVLAGFLIAEGPGYLEHQARRRKDAIEWRKGARAAGHDLVEAEHARQRLEKSDAVFMRSARDRAELDQARKTLAGLQLSSGYRQSGHPETDTDLQALALRARLAQNDETAAAVPDPAIHVLCRADSEITDDGVRHLKGLPRLKTLVLDGSKVTDGCLDHLLKMPDLEMVSLRRTRVTQREVNDLSRALPRLKIVR